jgi:sigma-54 dependent transcriptional regulator, acetoin dehydrogenase operon transcriptional activator AcoR
VQRPHKLLLRVNWSGLSQGEDSDGLVGLDADGHVVAANRAARQLLPQLGMMGNTSIHCRDLFALPFEMFFDAARRAPQGIEAPLWSGLRLHVQTNPGGQSQHFTSMPHWHVSPPSAPPAKALPLRDVETALIQKAVEEARGNVAQAARTLGISRATVYRKLPRPQRG